MLGAPLLAGVLGSLAGGVAGAVQPAGPDSHLARPAPGEATPTAPARPAPSRPRPGETLVGSYAWADAEGHLDRRQWREQRLRGRTRYRVEVVAGEPCLRAEADGAASALYHELDGVSADGVLLRWRWQALTFPAREDLAARSGDDRAAAVAVVFEKSVLPWKTKALFYVWSAGLPEGTLLTSPFTDSVRILVVRSGGASGWVGQSRDVAADYRRAFGEAPRQIEAIGVLTDADNTGSRAAARYGPLALYRRGVPPAGN